MGAVGTNRWRFPYGGKSFPEQRKNRMNAQDTIAAIATGASDAGIGIIRISGENAFGAASELFRTPGGRSDISDFAPNTIHFD